MAPKSIKIGFHALYRNFLLENGSKYALWSIFRQSFNWTKWVNSPGTILWFLKISKIFLRVRFIIYQKCPFKGQLSLAGYAQSFVPGELSVHVNIETWFFYLWVEMIKSRCSLVMNLIRLLANLAKFYGFSLLSL